MTRQKMTKKELAKEIGKRVREIRELYYSVYPKGNYLSFFFKKDCISFNNNCWTSGHDEDYGINYWESERGVKINGVWEDK